MTLEERASQAMAALRYKIEVAENHASMAGQRGNWHLAATEKTKAENLISAYVHMHYWLSECTPDYFSARYHLSTSRETEIK
jgi:hypothetical protein